MNRTQLKDFFREIRHSLTRFLSILCMVALGVAFFAGVRSSEPDMMLSADNYYDNANFFDIRVAGTLGLTEEDLSEIKKIDGVTNAYGAYQTDVMAQLGNSEFIYTAYSLNDKINKPDIYAGRLPERTDECFADKWLCDNMGLKIGDRICVNAGPGEDISEKLNATEFTITGYGLLPFFLSWERGTATIGDGDCDAFILLKDEAFNMDVYTSIYAVCDGADGLSCYRDEYDDYIEPILKKIEDIADARCEVRYAGIMDEGNEKISEGEAEVADARKQLEDAKQQLTDAENELSDAQVKITDAEKELEDGRAELEEHEKEYEDGVREYEDGLKQYEDGVKEYEDGKKKYEDGVKEYEDGKKKYEDGVKEYEKGRKEYENAVKEYEAGRKQFEDGKKEYEDALKKYEAGKAELEKQEAELKAGYAYGLVDESVYMAGMAAVEAGKASLEQSGEELKQAKAMLDATELELEEGKNVLQAAKSELDSAQSELSSAKQELESGKAELEDAKRELSDAQKELSDAKKELEDAKQELADGRKQLDDGYKDLEEGEKKLADGKTEYEDGKRKLSDAKATFERESADANKKLADADADIADAKQKLADLEYPEWYVLDRNSNRTYVEYGQDSQRIGAIGTLFPVIFFLVAALVSLTTMTRMIEEQRMQIGTMKALGYGKAAIASKYFFYALFASVIGSAVGVVLGSKFLPYVIINAYGILYINVTDILTPLNTGISVLAVTAAIGCVLIATLFACYRELMAVPAELMRPPSPKKGKRILLERIGFIWKKMSFSLKSTARNLFRYKKRLLMTVIGIGGCMGLLMVGFGLRDSIREIVTKQYHSLWTYDAYLSINEATDELDELVSKNEHIGESMYSHLVAIDAGRDGIKKDAFLFVPKTLDTFDDFVTLKDRVSGQKKTINDNGAIISEKLASLLSVQPGDEITISPSDTENYTVRIEDITENYLYNYVYMTPAYYKQVYGEDAEFNQLLLKTKGSMSQEVRESLGRSMLGIDEVSSVNFVKDLENTVDRMMTSLDDVVWVLILSAGLLAFIVVYNLNNINIIERRRELATLKVLGFYDGETAMYVYRENIVLTVLGIVAGVFIGLFLHQLVIKTCEIDIIMFGRDIKPQSYVICIILTFVFAAVVNFISYFSLKKIDMVESLKSVE